jgi:drug/metabolite transporter (DMT)-like permease
MILEIISKLASESLLSLYPVFVKNIGLPLSLQTWSRCFSYAVISAFFIDYEFVIKTMLTSNGMLLSLITIAHIYTSYRGFELLESGVAYSIFYLYPIMILLMANKKIHPIMGLAVIGVFLLTWNNGFDLSNISFHMKSAEGLIMIILAAFTEAVIYFLVRNIKTGNNWNHIFISYFLGAIVLSGFFYDKISSMKLNGRLSMSLGINSVIGLVGYLLRFYAVSRLDTMIYAPLSYFGIVMSFVYGFINGDSITFQKIIGTSLIIIANLFLL